jgi:hypothetical protein
MKQPPYAEEIKKTGFVLENQVAQTVKSSGWTVISNKYYVDDSEESVREIDLIAYKCTRVQHFDVYTTLIISCKKSEAKRLGAPGARYQPEGPQFRLVARVNFRH